MLACLLACLLTCLLASYELSIELSFELSLELSLELPFEPPKTPLDSLECCYIGKHTKWCGKAPGPREPSANVVPMNQVDNSEEQPHHPPPSLKQGQDQIDRAMAPKMGPPTPYSVNQSWNTGSGQPKENTYFPWANQLSNQFSKRGIWTEDEAMTIRDMGVNKNLILQSK